MPLQQLHVPRTLQCLVLITAVMMAWTVVQAEDAEALKAADTTSAAANANNTMSLGDGRTVKTNASTTIFLGTEYNPNKCVLQFDSLKCTSKDCGELNGYKLSCVKIGRQDGADKMQCQCPSNVTDDTCQNSTNPAVGGVPQFGDCSHNKQCVDSYGHVPSSLELRICAERIHCVKEVNTTASKPAEICHTCRSCIAQNGQQGKNLADLRRFDCRKICPAEVLDSLEKRNKKNLDIAASLGSGSAAAEEQQASGSGEGSGTGKKKAAPTSAPPSSTKKGAAAGTGRGASWTRVALVGTLVMMTARGY